jgi:2-oxoisovalerate dehydrogenase E1 component
LSTPTKEQYRCENLVDKAKGYGIEGVKIDGNNILSVYDTIKGVRDYCIREQKPYLIECMTFRMRGHEEASGTKYVPPQLFEEWGRKDPVKNFEQFLVAANVLTEMQVADIRHRTKEHIEQELAIAATAKEMTVDTDDELHDVYATRKNVVENIIEDVIPIRTSRFPSKNNIVDTEELRFIDAIKQAMQLAMRKHGDLVLMGQDIAEYGGAFKITEGFVEEFGKARVRNTPICESAIVGATLGLSLEGMKSIMEMQFADFATVGFNQIVNNLAKIYYRWGQNADVVIRMPTGGGVGAGPFHSQSNEAWFTHVPGLKVVYPSSAADAKGLLLAAIEDPNPFLYFEHKALYRSISDKVPTGYYEVEIGKANIVQEGDDISIITYGAGVHWAVEYAVQHSSTSFHILDLRTLLPLDYTAIKQAVEKTGRVLILHEDTLFGGIGGEIAAWISEHCFDKLDAPVMRCASLDTPIPFNIELEKNFMAKSRLDEFVKKLINY